MQEHISAERNVRRSRPMRRRRRLFRLAHPRQVPHIFRRVQGGRGCAGYDEILGEARVPPVCARAAPVPATPFGRTRRGFLLTALSIRFPT